MSGKLIGSFIVVTALISGGLIYWLQVYAFYDKVAGEPGLTMVNIATGQAEPFLVSDFQGIDASSSPLRYRACFRSSMSDAAMSETFEPYPDPTPLTGPGWFDCYDAVEIGEALERGEAMAFMSKHDIHDGVDRVVAVFPDGRAYAWHQLNEKYQD